MALAQTPDLFGSVPLFLYDPSPSCSPPPDLPSPPPLSLRYKNVERLAAEEYERDHVRVPRARADLGPTFEPSEAWPSSSRSSTPSSFASQEEADADLEAETPAASYTPSETGKAPESVSLMKRLTYGGNVANQFR